MTNDPPPFRLRILVFEDLPGVWTARALERDVLAEGRTMEAAVHAVLRIVRAHVDFDRRHNREPLSSFCAAPQVYWNAFTLATPLVWASGLGSMLTVPAEVQAAVAVHRPRTTAHRVALRPDPSGFRMASRRSADLR